MNTSWATEEPHLRDDIAAATRELRESAVREQLDQLSDVEVRQVAARLLWLLRRLGRTDQADTLEDQLDFEELQDAIRENAGAELRDWDEVKAELGL